MAKKTIYDFAQMKEQGKKITYLVVYDFYTARLAEQAGVDILLVGDTVGPAIYGLDTLLPVTMEQMIAHCRAVRKGAPNTFVIGDLPFLSYEVSVTEAVKNAGRLIKESEVDAVKPEGGRNMLPQIKAIIDAGIAVQGHLGFTPHYWSQMGGKAKIQADTSEAAIQVFEDAKAVEKAGAFSLVVVGVPGVVVKTITERLEVPVICMGAGPDCDGQALLSADMLGIGKFFMPEFIKKYANLSDEMLKAFKQYVEEVKKGTFPEEKHYHKLSAEEEKKFIEALK